jgi:hypothetical protein
MDHGVIALMIPIVAIVCATLLKLARLRAGDGQGASGDEIRHRLDTVEQEQVELRRELAEAQERLDFAERLLTQHQDKPLPPSK